MADLIPVRQYKFTEKEEKEILRKLFGQIGYRELARRIEVSPQQAINLTAAAACQWVREGRLVVRANDKMLLEK